MDVHGHNLLLFPGNIVHTRECAACKAVQHTVRIVNILERRAFVYSLCVAVRGMRSLVSSLHNIIGGASARNRSGVVAPLKR
jgi:hypothetical protein